MGSFGTMLLTTETGRLLLEKLIAAGDEKTQTLIEEGKTVVEGVDLEKFWHGESGKQESVHQNTADNREEKKEPDPPRGARRFFHRS